jgi:electron transfer flavoprotein alpha subunit
MKILLIAEHDQRQLKPSTLHAITAAQALKGDIDLLIIGHHCQTVVEHALHFPVQAILKLDHEVYKDQLAENCAAVIASISSDYHYILAPATTFGKNLLPRVAALCDVCMLSDVMKVISPDTFLRPIYAGNLVATIKINEPLKILTIRTTAFSACLSNHSINSIPVQTLEQVIPNTLSTFESHALTENKRPEITSARIIIAGGRGLKSKENFRLLEEIADDLGAAVGASRAAVDAGFAPNDYQIGQTGKIVAPDLYIAVGISGAIQHLAGIKESKIIVAINNDSDAPIFQVADYKLVGDLFTILPDLKNELKSILHEK